MGRKEVISYVKMWSLIEDCMNRSWKMINNDVSRLPEVIWFFRDGIADGHIREMNSKEVVGVQRAIREFARKNRIKVDGKLYSPKIQFVVVQKTILDRFGEVQHDNSLRPPRKASVIFDYVLSVRLWDFVAWYNTRGKNRPLRYIIVKDGMDLAKKDGAVDAFQFCYALCIKYAKHFAEIISQQILNSDKSFESLQTPEHLNRPHLCVTESTSALEE